MSRFKDRMILKLWYSYILNKRQVLVKETSHRIVVHTLITDPGKFRRWGRRWWFGCGWDYLCQLSEAESGQQVQQERSYALCIRPRWGKQRFLDKNKISYAIPFELECDIRVYQSAQVRMRLRRCLLDKVGSWSHYLSEQGLFVKLFTGKTQPLRELWTSFLPSPRWIYFTSRFDQYNSYHSHKNMK